MSWLMFFSLLLEYGLPFAERAAQKYESKGVVTPAEIDELKALSAQTPRTQLLAALTRAGISSDDPKAKDLLALIP